MRLVSTKAQRSSSDAVTPQLRESDIASFTGQFFLVSPEQPAPPPFVLDALERLVVSYIQSTLARDMFVFLSTPTIAQLCGSPGLGKSGTLMLAGQAAELCMTTIERYLLYRHPVEPLVTQIQTLINSPSDVQPPSSSEHAAPESGSSTASDILRGDLNLLNFSDLSDFPVASFSTDFPQVHMKLSQSQRLQWLPVIQRAREVGISQGFFMHGVLKAFRFTESQVDSTRILLVYLASRKSPSKNLDVAVTKLKRFLAERIEPPRSSWNTKRIRVDPATVGWTTEAHRHAGPRISRTLMAIPACPDIWFIIYHQKQANKKTFPAVPDDQPSSSSNHPNHHSHLQPESSATLDESSSSSSQPPFHPIVLDLESPLEHAAYHHLDHIAGFPHNLSEYPRIWESTVGESDQGNNILDSL